MLKFINDGISMSDRIKMVEMFEPYKHLFPNGVIVDFNRAMRTSLGKANMNLSWIKLNHTLITRHPEEMLPTFAHELAHLLAYKLHRGQRIKGHGPEWRSTMLKLGYEPSRTHDLDVSDIKRRWQRVKVKCACTTHSITMRQYKQMQLGSNWRCRKCKEFLGTTKV